jgi:capsular polysaccharide biosynthesis protein
VLPDSFRWHLKDELEVAGIRTIDEHFGRLRKGERGRRLDGSYFYFSSNNPGHYGHLMTEALSRLWGWWPAKAEDPSLRILCRLHPTRGDTAAERLETFLLPALGISPEDIVWVDGPVEVESLVGCTPMWHNAPPLYLHPAMLEVWDRLRTGVMREDAPPSPSRLFITRRVGGRPCSNIGEVEELFAAHGFTVVSPEQHSVPEQPRSSRALASWRGSAAPGCSTWRTPRPSKR